MLNIRIRLNVIVVVDDTSLIYIIPQMKPVWWVTDYKHSLLYIVGSED